MTIMLIPPLYEIIIGGVRYSILINEQWTGLTYDPSTNWDFYYVDDWSAHDRYSISDSQYVSEPTSLYYGEWRDEVYALSKHSQAQDLKAGRIACLVREGAVGVGASWIYIGVTGAGSQGIRLGLGSGGSGVWAGTRYSWWQEGGQTKVTQENWDKDTGEWTTVSTDTYSAMTGSTNRVGFGSTPQSLGYMRYFDNTVIERRV